MLDGYTAEILARVQFAFTVSFHIIFPAFSIGLASFLAVLNALWLWKREETYLKLFNYWKKIFAVAFGMGVVSGIVMSYQFGTNWSVFSDKAGPVVGPLMAYEVMSAFFLEAGFLGIMLFGREKVGERLHMFATAMVAIGTLMSATWILAVNSWMQTPQGYSIAANGQFVPEDWLAIIFSPSFPYRLVHMVLAAYLTVAFVVAAVSALHLLRDKTDKESRRAFSMAMWMAVLVTPIQIFAGDMHGINTLEHQPVKVAAMEGHFDSHGDNQPLALFGVPNAETGQLDYAIEVPYLGSLILTHSLNGQIKGLAAQRVQCAGAVLQPVEGVTLALERGENALGEGAIVFNQQQSHGLPVGDLVQSGADLGLAALIALNCNREIPESDFLNEVGVPAGQCHHCHTGKCPVGITTQDSELVKRLDPDEGAERVANFINSMTMEMALLTRSLGKGDVHSLEPEDLAALTIEASAMARVPLVGTNKVFGE
mgnify:CR=1 FL=1